MKKISIFLIIMAAGLQPLGGADWPIYKGNIYFTGNNDEITVKNNNLKWLFQADHLTFNPIVSDGKVYFVDMKKTVYCLDEESGKQLWKLDLNIVSSQFRAYAKSMGKVKYPLIKGDLLFLTDNIAIYCINKNNGKVLWARTGMRDEREMTERGKWSSDVPTGRKRPGGLPERDMTKTTYAVVDSIYSDPLIHGDRLYYGTRNVFISREVRDGHLKWNNSDIKSYSGFPSFYDNYIFTQSMDYGKNRFTLNCLDAETGKALWSSLIVSPVKIFPPVVYSGRVYLASNKTLYCFDLKSGAPAWEKEYADIITSNPAFTDREIIFAVGNREVVSVNPQDGAVTRRVALGEKSSPYFVIIRDQIYIASTFEKNVGGKMLPYSALRSLGMNDGSLKWEYVPPFPGGSGQPSASKGIMFLPAGNYIYAVGTDFYPRIVDGGSSVYDPYDSGGVKKGDDAPPVKKDGADKDTGRKVPEKKDTPAKQETRKMKVTVKGDDGRDLKGEAEIKKWDKGKEVYSRKTAVSRPDQEIDVPDLDDVEITVNADGYAPKKVIVSRKDGSKEIRLDRIEKGKGIVVENIYFEFDQAYLKKESLNILDGMIKAMKMNRGLKLEVRGHTDSVGERRYNMKLSERRSDAVVEYMVKNGISPERLKSAGLGPDRPIADNKTAEGRKKNRRTEFFVLDK